MAIKTVDLKEMSSKAENIYEAVLVIAKRARAITAERKAKEALHESDFDSTEELEAVEQEIVEEEKAILIAMDDFFDDKLDINYRVFEEEVLDEDEALIYDKKKEDVKAEEEPA